MKRGRVLELKHDQPIGAFDVAERVTPAGRLCQEASNPGPCVEWIRPWSNAGSKLTICMFLAVSRDWKNLLQAKREGEQDKHEEGGTWNDEPKRPAVPTKSHRERRWHGHGRQ